jgi:hypothetical protein
LSLAISAAVKARVDATRMQFTWRMMAFVTWPAGGAGAPRSAEGSANLSAAEAPAQQPLTKSQ